MKPAISHKETQKVTRRSALWCKRAFVLLTSLNPHVLNAGRKAGRTAS